MQARLVVAALIAFALGAAAARFARVTNYDRLIESQAQQIELRDKLIAELEAERAEGQAILRKGEPTP